MVRHHERSGLVARRVLGAGHGMARADVRRRRAVFATAAGAETVPEALVKAYQSNPQLNAERARQRATDENVPQALAGYRPQVAATLGVGLQAVRNLLPDNTIQGATLKPWTIGVTVTQTLFNGFKTANSVRVAELQVQSGREALRNVGQGVLLDAVTVYTNVLANQSLVEAQRANVTSLRETAGHRAEAAQCRRRHADRHRRRPKRGSPRGQADLNAAEVNLAISQATYAQMIGNPPSRLSPAEPVDRLLPRSRDDAIARPSRQHPAVLAAGYDVDVATTTISVAESSLLSDRHVAGQRQPRQPVRSDARHLPHRPGLDHRPGDRADL